MVDKNTNKGRGFGFVTYKDPPTANFVATLVHIIDGKKVDCKKARPRETPVDPIASDPNFKTSKIFVGGLPSELTVDALRDYFMRFGEVVDCVIVSDKETKQSRCFGFVQFTTCHAVEEVMRNYYNIIIRNKWVECKKALPKETCSELLKGQNKSRGGYDDMQRANNSNSLPVPADLYKIEDGMENQNFYGRNNQRDNFYKSDGYPSIKEINYSGFNLMDMNGFPKQEVKLEGYYNENDEIPVLQGPGQDMAQTYNLPTNPIPLQQRHQNWVKQEPGNVTIDYENETKQKLKIEGSGVQKIIPADYGRNGYLNKQEFQPF